MAISDIWRINNAELNEGSVDNVMNPIMGEDSIKEGETYTQYGLRICGRVTGCHPALTPYLSKIFNEEKRLQHRDEATQTILKQQLMQEIVQIDGEIAKIENQKTGLEDKIQRLDETILETKDKLSRAKSKDGEINRMARAKFTIGSLIIVLLTIYLFIFYSSTFYSAFLYQPSTENDLSLGSAMLNARAYSEALQLGFGPFIFIVTAPIIFLGLGYSLHFFMIQKEAIKWFKIAALLYITFAFDCILAYKIGELIYNEQWNSGDYAISMAINDVNSWAVIFCGFIVYLIWGIVFDMIMSAYEELRSNKHEINQLELKIEADKNNLSQLRQDIIDADGEIHKLQNNKRGIQERINNSILVDYTKIKTALSDFFAGWVTMMSALGHSEENQAEAKRIYDQTITQLFN
ncbi:MAG: hypothetical protein J1E84_04985 [Muribaculaceae bacterium]|nr:hypothetical protein [Muribaculaceae bacterium]